MNLYRLLVILISLMAFSARAQYSYCLKTVALKNGTTGFVNFVNDISEHPYVHPEALFPYSTHQYINDSPNANCFGPVRQPLIDDSRAPAVAYVSGSKPHMGATFYADCDEPVFIRAKLDIPASLVSPAVIITWKAQQVVPSLVSPGSQLFAIEYPFVESDVAFPAGYTLSFEPAVIKFEISQTSSFHHRFTQVKTGGPDLYVTAGEMPTGADAPLTQGRFALVPRYSAFRNGCAFASGTDNFEEWLDATFTGYFMPKQAVRGKNGKELKYWDSSTPNSCKSMAEFFRDGNGSCGYFVSYFSEMINLQGYPCCESETVVFSGNSIVLPNGNRTGPFYLDPLAKRGIENLLDRKTKYSSCNLSDKEYWLVANTGNETPEDIYSLYEANKLFYRDDMDKSYIDRVRSWYLIRNEHTVISAQNSSLPKHFFADHTFHEFDEMLADPSYGLEIRDRDKHVRRAKYEDDNIAVTSGVLATCLVQKSINAPLIKTGVLIPPEVYQTGNPRRIGTNLIYAKY